MAFRLWLTVAMCVDTLRGYHGRERREGKASIFEERRVFVGLE